MNKIGEAPDLIDYIRERLFNLLFDRDIVKYYAFFAADLELVWRKHCAENKQGFAL